VTNCNALRQAIPGTPSGYNSRLSDFCRAADTGIVLTVNDGSTTIFENNILYSASATALELDINLSCSTATCLIQQRNNIFIGFENNVANGYPRGGKGEYSNPIYAEDSIKAYRNPGSSFEGNTTYHASKSWFCPATHFRETKAKCGDPHLKDQTWHLYGYGDMTPTGAAGSATTGDAGHASSDPPEKLITDKLIWKCLGAAAVATVAYKAVRSRWGRSTDS
jgi:hypothetical protein